VSSNHTISILSQLPASSGGAFTVTAAADYGSTVSQSGPTGVASGGSVTFTFSAKPGYAITGVRIDGVDNPSAAAAGSYTFSGVSSNHTISILSEPSPYTGEGTSGNGSGNGSGSNGGDDRGEGSGSAEAGSSGGISTVVLAILGILGVAIVAGVLWLTIGRGRRIG
jgi:hypothetical protein